VQERLNWPLWKGGIPATVSWVRIPPSPLDFCLNIIYIIREVIMNKYFISYALKFNDEMLSHITQYGNVVLDLPHTINDESDIADIQSLIEKNYTEYKAIILWFEKLPI
jgi:hypothetical protein